MTPPTMQKTCRQVKTMQQVSDNDRFPSRKHPRLKQFDYSSPNYYFITVCTGDRRHLFGEARKLNRFGEIALEAIQRIPDHFPQVTVEKAVVMPNHVHMILALQDKGSDISTIVGQYKSYVSRCIRQIQSMERIWQTSFHDHVIRNKQSYEKIWLYIHANPDNWEKDCFYSEKQT